MFLVEVQCGGRRRGREGGRVKGGCAWGGGLGFGSQPREVQPDNGKWHTALGEEPAAQHGQR